MKRYSNKEKLAVRLPNWIGDALMAYPLLAALSRSGVEFTCFGIDWVSSIFSGTDFDLVADSRVQDKLWLMRQYREGGYTHAILCPSSLSGILPAMLAKLKTSGYNRLCAERFIPKKGAHRVENYFELGQSFIGSNLKLQDCNQFIPVHHKNDAAANEIIKNGIGSDYTVVCPYATNLHKGKNKEWPHWKAFLQTFEKANLVALVAPEDEVRCRQDFPSTKVLSVNLGVTAAIMQKANCVLTNDSGAMHLASFFGAKVVGLFGVTDIYETRPWFGNYLVEENGNWVALDVLEHYLKTQVGVVPE